MYTYIYTISIYALHRLSQLDKLQVLDLSFNPLGEVPEVVYSMSQLTELNLTRCNLSNISDRYVYYDNTLQNLLLCSIHNICMCIICVAKITKHYSLILATPLSCNPYILYFSNQMNCLSACCRPVVTMTFVKYCDEICI